MGVKRSYGGLKRFLRKHFSSPVVSPVRPKKPQVYDGGKYPGERVQIDVKYVPKACLYGEKLYQYTLVDECSSWCCREIHPELSEYASSQFIRCAFKAVPFKICEVQTDNGHEFTNVLFGQKRAELTHFEVNLAELGISYRRLRFVILSLIIDNRTPLRNRIIIPAVVHPRPK